MKETRLTRKEVAPREVARKDIVIMTSVLKIVTIT